MYKTCNKCDTTQKVEDFYKDKSTKDGHKNICKSCDYINHKNFMARNPEYQISKYRENPDKYLAYGKKYRLKYPDKINQRKRAWEKNNSEKFKSTRRAYENKRMKSDINFRLTKTLRTRLNAILQKDLKKGSAVKDLGCSVNELKAHLESLFQQGMTWDNHGKHGWHIDHVTPLSSFDLTDAEQFKKAVHYTNLQPLWAKDNLAKKDKICQI